MLNWKTVLVAALIDACIAPKHAPHHATLMNVKLTFNFAERRLSWDGILTNLLPKVY